MAVFTLRYEFSLGEFFNRSGFAIGGLTYIGEKFRPQAKNLITQSLAAARLPFSVLECGSGTNPCGLALNNAAGTRISDFRFDRQTGVASYEDLHDRRRCDPYADQVLQALTEANKAFALLALSEG